MADHGETEGETEAEWTKGSDNESVPSCRWTSTEFDTFFSPIKNIFNNVRILSNRKNSGSESELTETNDTHNSKMIWNMWLTNLSPCVQGWVKKCWDKQNILRHISQASLTDWQKCYHHVVVKSKETQSKFLKGNLVTTFVQVLSDFLFFLKPSLHRRITQFETWWKKKHDWNVEFINKYVGSLHFRQKSSHQINVYSKLHNSKQKPFCNRYYCV